MYEITHQEAQRLIQIDSDHTLRREDKLALNNHLEKCVECSNYAKKLAELESGLKRVLHTALDSQLPSLNMQAIIKSTTNFSSFPWESIFNPTQVWGRVTICISLIIGYFIVANLFGGQVLTTGNHIPTYFPTPHDLTITNNISPTPSTPSATIGINTQECKTINYVVQDDESLVNIAVRFGVSTKLILTYSNLKQEDVIPGKVLSIPHCEQTPSLIAITTQNALTFTPLGENYHPTQAE